MARQVHLFDRDVQVLELLAERGVESLPALHERLWPNAAQKSAYNRLGDLSRAGYLTHVSRADLGSPKVGRPAYQHLYLLGPKAAIALRLRDRAAHRLALRRVKAGISAALIEHQLATNRVSDWLGVRLLSEAEAGAGMARRQRPDGAYRSTADSRGRELVLVEIDLGHYSRPRILTKIDGFLGHDDARDMIITTPAVERADLIGRWIREAYGPRVMERVHVLAFDELRRGTALPSDIAPIDSEPVQLSGWHDAVLGQPGVRGAEADR